MPGSRVIYQNWIVELGLDPLKIKNFFDIIESSSEKSAEIDHQVRAAMESLSEAEMEFVIRFYFMGQG